MSGTLNLFAHPDLSYWQDLSPYRSLCYWQAYRAASTLGGTRLLPYLFQAAGADFSLQPEVVKGVADFLAATLAL